MSVALPTASGSGRLQAIVIDTDWNQRPADRYDAPQMMIDSAPTVLEAAGLPEPTQVNGAAVGRPDLMGARNSITGEKVLAPGKHTVVFDFVYDGGGPGKGGLGSRSVNGEKIAEGRIEQTQSGLFSAEETTDV